MDIKIPKLPTSIKNLTKKFNSAGPLMSCALIGLTVEEAGENLSQIIKNRKMIKKGEMSFSSVDGDDEEISALISALANLPTPLDLFGAATYKNILTYGTDREKLLDLAESLDEEAKAIIIYYVVHGFDQNGERICLTTPVDRATTDCILLAQAQINEAKTNDEKSLDLKLLNPDAEGGLLQSLSNIYDGYLKSAMLRSSLMTTLDLCFVMRTYQSIMNAKMLTQILY